MPPHSSVALGDLRSALPPLTLRRLPNGLRVGLLPNHRSPVVATALVYGVGARHETSTEAGAAHFLEHMMFKGSARYGPGEIDHLTRALGGSNNAFTSHDLTLYYFTFAADRWRHALDLEADRMASLTLDAAEVERERQVILEELAMYEDEPWEALEQEISTSLFAPHPYGRPVIGTRDSLAQIDAAALRDFHRRHYHPANAVLLLAGDLDAGAFEDVEKAFGPLDAGPAPAPMAPAPTGGKRPSDPRRIERRHGEVPRFLFALPAPAARHPDHPLLLLLTAVLGFGRASRLHRALVDEGQLCLWVSAELQETQDPGLFACALEVVPGVEPAVVEQVVLDQIEALRRDGPTEEEVARARRILLADWLFGHEKVYQQAFLMGTALTLFDAEHPFTYFDTLLQATADQLQAVARRHLRPEHAVLGWSLPATGTAP